MTTLTHWRSKIAVPQDPTERMEYALIGVWLLGMISLPIALWTLGDGLFAPGITLAALLQGTAVFYSLQRQWGLRRAVITLGIVAVTTWTAEFIGSKTGLIFGNYNYTNLLQPQIMDVPLLIPLAWFMLLPSSWVMAQLIVGKTDTGWRKSAFVLVSAVALTAWDLFLDPQMVARGFWVWEQPSGYFGIPWSNYAGWLVTAAVVTILVRPARLNIMPLAALYALVWFLQSVGQAVFWGQPEPAFFGCVAMGAIMLLAYQQQKRRAI